MGERERQCLQKSNHNENQLWQWSKVLYEWKKAQQAISVHRYVLSLKRKRLDGKKTNIRAGDASFKIETPVSFCPRIESFWLTKRIDEKGQNVTL
ncbi:hypothetical protein AVEN_71963-1 [Araneus ventricosus]|uniref:Uncharacterized protein n=1 Tax=Araneus ventricosus TaxID=182803 RepID=A0A4Y2F615_ARAVE|nr:hypothetical protein AVEN_71963-1 [Araneus ventricosus]